MEDTDTRFKKRTPHYTPGPWIAEGTEVYFERDHVLICDTNSLKWSMADDEPNARLIAAAPELLEALEELVSNLEEVIDIGKPEMLGKSWAVIRKAKGLGIGNAIAK